MGGVNSGRWGQAQQERMPFLPSPCANYSQPTSRWRQLSHDAHAIPRRRKPNCSRLAPTLAGMPRTFDGHTTDRRIPIVRQSETHSHHLTVQHDSDTILIRRMRCHTTPCQRSPMLVRFSTQRIHWHNPAHICTYSHKPAPIQLTAVSVCSTASRRVIRPFS
jgi:hypothetical protein